MLIGVHWEYFEIGSFSSHPVFNLEMLWMHEAVLI